MHELSICRSIARIVERNADGHEVEVVRLRVGALRQVVPDTLRSCWSLVSEHTGFAGADLQIELVPATVACRACQARTELSVLDLVCGTCGGTDVTLVAGEEFLVTSLDLRHA